MNWCFRLDAWDWRGHAGQSSAAPLNLWMPEGGRIYACCQHSLPQWSTASGVTLRHRGDDHPATVLAVHPNYDVAILEGPDFGAGWSLADREPADGAGCTIGGFPGGRFRIRRAEGTWTRSLSGTDCRKVLGDW